eukprot:TRINITY_DN1686_c0_g1_i2.p1 TRINITY_DN1686_c0_g1~~TRINITY_DN1686_c0_g1_i2.p1  ORF type:complete len:367 (-),score=49.57 TRINITY_DN1686_c0_g1_i2:84-1184(-)
MSWSRMSGPRFHHGSQAMSGGLFVAAVSDDTGARPSARHSHRRPPRPPQQQGNGRDWSQRNHNRDKLPPLSLDQQARPGQGTSSAQLSRRTGHSGQSGQGQVRARGLAGGGGSLSSRSVGSTSPQARQHRLRPLARARGSSGSEGESLATASNVDLSVHERRKRQEERAFLEEQEFRARQKEQRWQPVTERHLYKMREAPLPPVDPHALARELTQPKDPKVELALKRARQRAYSESLRNNPKRFAMAMPRRTAPTPPPVEKTAQEQQLEALMAMQAQLKAQLQAGVAAPTEAASEGTSTGADANSGPGDATAASAEDGGGQSPVQDQNHDGKAGDAGRTKSPGPDHQVNGDGPDNEDDSDFETFQR